MNIYNDILKDTALSKDFLPVEIDGINDNPIISHSCDRILDQDNNGVYNTFHYSIYAHTEYGEFCLFDTQDKTLGEWLVCRLEIANKQNQIAILESELETLKQKEKHDN